MTKIQAAKAVVEAARKALGCPPPGRRLGKQESMQARWWAAQEDLSDALTAYDAAEDVSVDASPDACREEFEQELCGEWVRDADYMRGFRMSSDYSQRLRAFWLGKEAALRALGL